MVTQHGVWAQPVRAGASNEKGRGRRRGPVVRLARRVGGAAALGYLGVISTLKLENFQPSEASSGWCWPK